MSTRRRVLLVATHALVAAGGFVSSPSVGQSSAGARRIGILLPNATQIPERNPRIQAFRQGLRAHGWIEGQNLSIEWRLAGGSLTRLDELAAELVRLRVDVIVTAATSAAKAAKAATHSIPIVMMDPGDPVALGLVASLARPGGNVTGVASIAPDLAGKRLALLKEIAPEVSHVAVLSWTQIPPAELAMNETQTAAASLGIRVLSILIQDRAGMAVAFAQVLQERCNGLLIFPDPLTLNNGELIVSFAAQQRIATLYGAKEFAQLGGLMSFGPSYPGMFRRGAYFVDRILKGTPPAELPVEQPTLFELVVNLTTAKEMGMKVPQSILLRADEVIG